jgi:hypothetical protein
LSVAFWKWSGPALCVLPDPTMASKAGCVVFGVHGSDSAAAGVRLAWTGRDTATLTQQGTTKLAEAMKASPDMASSIGLSLEAVLACRLISLCRLALLVRSRLRGLPDHTGTDQSGVT